MLTSIMTDFNRSLQTILDLNEKAKSWTTSSLLLKFAAGLQSDDPIKVDAIPSLGHDCQKPIAQARNDITCHWFPSDWNEINKSFRSEMLYPTIVCACAKSGLKVGCKYKKILTLSWLSVPWSQLCERGKIQSRPLCRYDRAESVMVRAEIDMIINWL